MKPATAAKKLGVHLDATPEEFRAGLVSRDELDALQADPPEWLRELRPFIDGAGAAPLNQQEVATRLGVPVATLRTWLSRLRHRYRETLRAEVASTVSDLASVDQELHYLHQLLAA